MITLEEIQEINRRFGDGKIINTSIYYAIDQKSVKSNICHLLRALIIDHIFSDGNKRTAYVVARLLFERNNININKDTLLKCIIRIARENISEIGDIGRLVERCIKK